MDDRSLETGLRDWAAPRDALDQEVLVLALYLEGAATIEERAEARAILAADPELAEAFQIVSRPRVRSWRPPIAVALAALALAVLFVFAPRSPEQPELVPKGAADRVSLAVERLGERFVLDPGRPLKEGDRLGFFYSAAEPGHLAIVHHSAAGTQLIYSGAITPNVGAALPRGAEVRDVSGCEWLVAVFSERPLAIAELAEELSSDPRSCRLSPKISEARTLEIIEIER